jgi:hypothetical protein
MSRIQPLIWLLIVFSGLSPSSAQSVFKVIPTTITSAEGGSANVLLIQVNDRQFSLRIPKGYGTEVREESRGIIFTSENGGSTIVVRATTNYPGALPPDLADVVAKKYPGAAVQSSSCVSDYGRGLCFDLAQMGQNGLALRIRDAYISYPEGSFEFVFSCNDLDYEQNRLKFVWLLNSFRSQPKSAKKDS